MPSERVLRVASFVAPTGGGIRTVLHRLSQADAERGIDVHVAVPGPDAGLDGDGRYAVQHLPGVRMHPGQPYRLLVRRTPIRRMIDDIRPTRVEIHDQLTLAWLGPHCRSLGIPTTLIVHERLADLAGFWGRVPLLGSAAERWTRRIGAGVDRVVGPSDVAVAAYREAGIDAAVVPWGVDHATFRPGPRQSGGVIRLVHCGRLSAEKDAVLSVRCARLLAMSGERVSLTVIGDGPERPRLHGEAGPETEFLGFVRDPVVVADRLRTADVFLAPGPFETFGISALEAMACGVPVICRRSGAIGEIPMTTPADTSEEMATAAMRLAHDTGARDAATEVAKRYSWGAAAERLGMVSA